LTRRPLGPADAPMIEAVSALHNVARVDGDSDAVFSAWLTARGWHHALIVFFGDDPKVGWLAVARGADGDEFAPQDVRLFEAIANQLSVALENSRLIGELSAEVHEREHRALHDPLTDLANRASFTDALEREMAASGELGQVAVLIVALDDFREINETLGHDHGDDVLREVATRLRDLCPSGWVPARLDGDEFAILLPAARGVGAAARTAEMVVHVFEEEPFHVAGLVIELGVRIGVAVYPEHGRTAQQLLRRAEIALHGARA